MDPEIADCLRRWRAGVDRERAATRLDALLRPLLSRYFAYHGHSIEESEDLVQGTLLRVFQGVGALRDEASFEPWLFVVARNVRRSARRAASRGADLGWSGTEPAPEPEAPGPSPAEAAEASRELAELRRALAALAPQQRRCLVLRARDGLAYGDIARLLGLSVLTVRNHLAAARRELRRRLRGAIDEEVGE